MELWLLLAVWHHHLWLHLLHFRVGGKWDLALLGEISWLLHPLRFLARRNLLAHLSLGALFTGSPLLTFGGLVCIFLLLRGVLLAVVRGAHARLVAEGFQPSVVFDFENGGALLQIDWVVHLRGHELRVATVVLRLLLLLLLGLHHLLLEHVELVELGSLRHWHEVRLHVRDLRLSVARLEAHEVHLSVLHRAWQWGFVQQHLLPLLLHEGLAKLLLLQGIVAAEHLEGVAHGRVKELRHHAVLLRVCHLLSLFLRLLGFRLAFREPGPGLLLTILLGAARAHLLRGRILVLGFMLVGGRVLRGLGGAIAHILVADARAVVILVTDVGRRLTGHDVGAVRVRDGNVVHRGGGVPGLARRAVQGGLVHAAAVNVVVDARAAVVVVVVLALIICAREMNVHSVDGVVFRGVLQDLSVRVQVLLREHGFQGRAIR